MAKNCDFCKKSIGILGDSYTIKSLDSRFAGYNGRVACLTCSDAINRTQDILKLGANSISEVEAYNKNLRGILLNAQKASSDSKMKSALGQLITSADLAIKASNYKLAEEAKLVEKQKKRQEAEHRKQDAEARKRLQELNTKQKKILVTTGDIKEDYEIIGPVYFQLSNKGLFSSTYDQLYSKYANEINRLKNRDLLSERQGTMDWGWLLYGEFSAGQNKFEISFYIAVEELKKRAAIMGADAIVAMRQDIDLDTSGFAWFYLQMYGTAVKFKEKQE